ncbi:MAG: hypothetical protein JNL11_08670 [Bdellovibrionaceae bacterium]|nr:hypothetical protein [Pseudobdellovibrionaceae bacterium]
MKIRLFSVILLSLLVPFGCTDRVETVRVVTPEAQKVQDVPIGQSVDVRDARAEECSTGGIVYSVFVDVNLNAQFDSEDMLVKKYPICNGSNGVNGSNGSNGVDGNGVAFAVVEASRAECSGGGSTILMASDVGNTGVYKIDAPNQQSMTICNGVNAVLPAYTPVETIVACGNNVSHKEVLLRLNNGQVLGTFSNDTGGTMTRLAFIQDGTFMNTDNSGCVFSLSTSSDGATRSISWGGQTQTSWALQR